MIEALLKGFAISLLLIFSVGPVIFTIIKQSINNGRAGGLSFVAGVWLSDLFLVVISNVFTELVSQLMDFKKEIGFTGSALLIAMGVYYLFFKKIHIKEDENKIVITARTHAKLILSGFLINTLNPALLLFWLTTATALTATHTINQRIIIFATCLIINSASDIFKVVLAGKLRSKLNEKNISLINKISGLILLIFGIVIIAGVFYSTAKH
ncbi:LysE family translocator [Ferruginibacter sp.]|jgi:threonine/homoserine/homoserine lactone efflux protein|uniref:LysE family translocator n=1 Tax=Ferruginibacter sp. TaxID=1940288 RepID=UPI0019C8B033|nr:LysE family transporter [Ferruginibacter sp.]MBC7626976.1 LysE family transporter [Ferruginibacter sp.]